MAGNKTLRSANKTKDDEFYTQLSDIEKEMKHYREYFKDKVILCNCDDPIESNFFKYFELNFYILGLKKLITTHFDSKKTSYKLEITRDDRENGLITSKDIVKTKLKQNGDFRSPECIELLKEADIVITNPPFSLFREYVSQLMEYNKKFIIIGNQNALTYKEIFPLIKDNKIWLGYYSGDMEFIVPPYYEPRATRYREGTDGTKYRSLGNICWFTNLDTIKRHENIILYKNYSEAEYPRFDNYDAINVNKVAEIPMDYNGLMAVPITFLEKYNPEQFTVVDALNRYALIDIQHTNEKVQKEHSHTCNINGRPTYFRIVIKRKDDE